MEKHPETMEDLLCYLESARDSLLMIHTAVEQEIPSTELLLSVVYGAYNHLDFIAKEMAKHINHIPGDILREAGAKVGR